MSYKFKNIIQNKGITLSELMVSVLIFSMMSVALGMILNMGLKSWRDVDGKVEAESGLNKAVKDINETIRNSKYFAISSDYVFSGKDSDSTSYGYIILPSYAKYTENYIQEQELDFELSLNPDTSETGDITFSTSYQCNFLIAYFLVRNNDCSKCKDLFGVETDLGVNCPHKTLVKKWYKVTTTSFDGVTDTWNEDISISDFKSKNFNDYMSHRSAYDKILSQNIMAFGARLDTDSHMISYKLKAFKPNTSKSRPSIDEMRESLQSFYDSSINDPLAKYSIEIHSTVAPLNQ